MFDWTGFENREFCVDFKNDAGKMEFLRECEKRGYYWSHSKSNPTLKTHVRKIFVAIPNGKGILHNCDELPAIIYNPHPIDCSIAENFAGEYGRMCKSQNICGINCPLYKDNGLDCPIFITDNPKNAVEIVQAWSDEHPIEPVVTYLDKLLKVFPSVAIRGIDGTPVKMCPSALGLNDLNCVGETGMCKKCWSQPYKENNDD